ncbi:MAG: glycosyl transferase, partial [Thermoflexus sp.]
MVVQIPAYNEAETIGAVIQEIPREIPGVSRVTVLVVDDGSTDGTAAAAR